MSEGDDKARLRELLDKLEIQECLIRYARGVDRCDPELISSAYHPDAIDHHGALTANGAEIGAILAEKQLKYYKSTFHHIGNISIKVEGNKAAAETYWTCALLQERNGAEIVIDSHGRYLDRFERRNGEWRISARTVMTAWGHSRPAGQKSDFVAPESKRTHEDMSYSNFDLSR